MYFTSIKASRNHAFIYCIRLCAGMLTIPSLATTLNEVFCLFQAHPAIFQTCKNCLLRRIHLCQLTFFAVFPFDLFTISSRDARLSTLHYFQYLDFSCIQMKIFISKLSIISKSKIF